MNSMLLILIIIIAYYYYYEQQRLFKKELNGDFKNEKYSNQNKTISHYIEAQQNGDGGKETKDGDVLVEIMQSEKQLHISQQ